MPSFSPISGSAISGGEDASVVLDSVTETATASDSVEHIVVTPVTETASASESVSEQIVGVFNEVATASEDITESGDRTDFVVDVAQAFDSLQSSIQDSVEEIASASDEPIETIIATTEEVATAQDDITEDQSLDDSFTETASASDQVKESIHGVFEETATASDTVFESNSKLDSVTEVAVASESVIHVLTDTADAFEEVAQGEDSIVQSLDAIQVIEEEAVAEDSFYDGHGLSAWSSHIETFGMSQFTGIEAVSAAAVGGTVHVAGPDGHFTLTAENDDGDPISASVRPFPTDFRDPRLKRPKYLYIGYEQGRMSINVTNHEQGKKKKYNYKVDQRKDDAAVPGRAKLGRGTKSRYFEVELVNVSGSRFVLHDAKLVVDETERTY